MAIATVTSKGQITIPASVRMALGISAGTRVEFVEMGKGQYMLVPAIHSVEALKGLLHKPIKPVTIEAMNEAITVQGGAGQMIGLDTNVLVRYLAQDDKKQAAFAGKIIGGLTALNPGYVTLVGLVELVWVMKSCYNASKPEIVVILDQLLRTQEILVENAETAYKALQLFSTSQVDFADCLIERSSTVAGCEKIFTFDRRAATLGNMTLIE